MQPMSAIPLEREPVRPSRSPICCARPTWSPDGRRIAFDYGGTIFSVNADGSELAELGPGWEPDWGPDGRIAFSWVGEGRRLELWVMDADGTNRVQLTQHAGVRNPRWSPDGTRIAFEDIGEVWTVEPDGSSPCRVWSLAPVLAASGGRVWGPSESARGRMRDRPPPGDAVS